MVDLDLTRPSPTGGFTTRILALIFCASILLSATLLFSVQPLFTKMVLPVLGGSSGVWNTAMVFFQALLLGGYLYAWAISRFLPLRLQVFVHILVMAAGFLLLPLAAANWAPPEGTMPTVWLIGLFGASVGVPFFALSANAPLLQRWLSYTDHADADDPYWLYAVSNAGSLLILCAYPFLIEPLVDLHVQSRVWSMGFMALTALLLLSGVTAWSRRAVASPAIAVEQESPITAKRAAFWVLLAFVPSSLMLGATSQLANSIAAGPFLWIMPLALYLLTFVLAFSPRFRVSAKSLEFPALGMAALAILFTLNIYSEVLNGLVHVSSVFVISLYCHTRLVEARPDTGGLTLFYVFMSLGGVLGGAFNALLAPVLFDTIREYALVLGAMALIVPGFTVPTNNRARVIAISVAVTIAASFAVDAFTDAEPMRALLLLVPAIGAILRTSLVRSILIYFAVTYQVGIAHFERGENVFADRSFYSTMRVTARTDGDHRIHVFHHGNTIHNLQIMDGPLRTEPLAYYAKGGAFHNALLETRRVTPTPTVAVVGLGAGAMACHEQPGESWTYFEIDPAVVEMAKHPANFAYLSECAPTIDVVEGDARLTMEALPDERIDLILIDAFSSDSIPAHLLTREALELYTSKLSDRGLIFFHTSNRMLDVSSVVAVTSAANGLDSVFTLHTDFDGHPYPDGALLAEGMLVGSPERVADIERGEAWNSLKPAARIRPWTDGRYSVIGAMIAHINDEAEPVDSMKTGG